MAKKSTKVAESKRKPPTVELATNAWPKFEALVKSAAKMGHKPHAPLKDKPTKMAKR